jgi:hypothetical protein
MDKRYLKSAAVERTIGRRLGRLKGILSIRSRRDTLGSLFWVPLLEASGHCGNGKCLGCSSGGECSGGTGGGAGGCAMVPVGSGGGGAGAGAGAAGRSGFCSSSAIVSAGSGGGGGPGGTNRMRFGRTPLSDQEKGRLKEFWKLLPKEDKHAHLALSCQQVRTHLCLPLASSSIPLPQYPFYPFHPFHPFYPSPFPLVLARRTGPPS